MTDQLSIFNGALRHLGNRKLATLTDNDEAQFVLNDIWAADSGVIQYCLEQGFWHFAMRTAKLEFDPDIAPDFGYPYAFGKPNDWVRTAGVCLDEFFNTPLTQYTDEAGYWYAALNPIYVRFVSNSNTYGNNMGKWPATFTAYVEGYLAWKASPRISAQKTEVARLEKTTKALLLDARSKAAMAEATAFLPAGTWSRARRGRWTGTRTPTSIP